jgi:hypothetical protein
VSGLRRKTRLLLASDRSCSTQNRLFKYPAREQFFRSEQRRNCHRHIEQKTSLCLNLFFSAFLNGPAIDANLDFVAMGALRKNIDRSFEWGG